MMDNTRRLVQALRALLDGLGNPEFTASSLHESGVRVRPEGAPVLDAAVSRVWVKFSGVVGRWQMNSPEAGTLDARRFGALIRVRGLIGERRPLPARDGDTPEARAAREAIGVWVRRRVEAGVLIPPAVAEAVGDALELLTLPDATGSARAELPGRPATRGNLAALAFARIVETAIGIRDDADRLVQRTKPDSLGREKSEVYLHRLAGEHFEERVRPGAHELYARAESLRAMRTAAKVAAAKVSRALAVEVEDRCASVIDAAIGLTGNLPSARKYSAEYTRAWAKLNDALCDAVPVVDLLWESEAEPDGEGAGLAELREKLERLIASAEAGAKPGANGSRDDEFAGIVRSGVWFEDSTRDMFAPIKRNALRQSKTVKSTGKDAGGRLCYRVSDVAAAHPDCRERIRETLEDEGAIEPLPR